MEGGGARCCGGPKEASIQCLCAATESFLRGGRERRPPFRRSAALGSKDTEEGWRRRWWRWPASVHQNSVRAAHNKLVRLVGLSDDGRRAAGDQGAVSIT